MSVREYHVVGVGDAAVAREAECGEDGLAAAVLAREGVRPKDPNGAVYLNVGKSIRHSARMSNLKFFSLKVHFKMAFRAHLHMTKNLPTNIR